MAKHHVRNMWRLWIAGIVAETELLLLTPIESRFQSALQGAIVPCTEKLMTTYSIEVKAVAVGVALDAVLVKPSTLTQNQAKPPIPPAPPPNALSVAATIFDWMLRIYGLGQMVKDLLSGISLLPQREGQFRLGMVGEEQRQLDHLPRHGFLKV